MSLRSKFITGITAVVAAGAFSIAGYAQSTAEPKGDGAQKVERHEGKGFRGGKMRGMHGEGKMRGMRGLRALNLTDDQKTAIKAIHESHRQSDTTREEMRSIMQARRAGTITPEQTERLKVLRDEMRLKMEGVHLQILNVLTPEQRQQLETQKLERQKRMEERREQRQLFRQQRRSKTEQKTDN